MRATPSRKTSAETWCRGKSSTTGRRRRLQPRWAVASGRSGAAFGPCAKRARSKSDGGYARVRRRMCGFCPSGLTSGLKVQASGLASYLASYQASGLIQNHVLNHRRTTLKAAARARSVKSAGTTGRPNTGPSATNARSQQPRKDETRSSNDATRKPGQSSSESCLNRRAARAETPTARATGGCVWTARASPAQRSVTLFERKTVAGVKTIGWV